MDSIFLLDDGARTNFLQHIVQTFGCSYISLWSYFPQPSSCLISIDGLYIEEGNQPSSSSGSLARRLFDEYRQAVFILENGGVPGLAFKNAFPYMELKELELQSLASVEPQLQFYQEARIKIAIFMGCKTGEIELGIANDTQVNLETELRNWFPEDFSRQPPPRELSNLPEQPRPSSSSSSLRSLSMDSPEISPFLFTIPSTSSLLEPPKESPFEEAFRPISLSPLLQAKQSFIPIPTLQFPTVETKDELEALTKSISSQKPSAFKRFRSSLGPSTVITGGVRMQNIQKRAITFFRGLGLMRIQGQVQGSRPPTSTSQLHHMISERKRREKLNESFQALRSLLPPGTKKDKASVLASTTECLASLKAQVEELTKRNKDLEAKALLATKEAAYQEVGVSSSNERIEVRVTHEAESTSQAQFIGLQIIVRGECNHLDLVLRVLEFLKKVENASLLHVEAQTQVVDSNNPIHLVRLRLKIEGGEWDESAFQEAVRRVVADLAQ